MLSFMSTLLGLLIIVGARHKKAEQQ